MPDADPPASGVVDVSPAWRMWMADNVARGADDADILARVAEEGVAAGLARAALASVHARPRVVRGLGRRWGELSAWTPEALAASHGDAVVEVTIDRDRDPSYRETFVRKTRLMPLAELAGAMRTVRTPDLYLVAQSHALDRSGLRAHLERTVRVPPEIARSGPYSSFVWIGPAGSVTTFHHDVMDLIAIQLHGRKRWRTIAPTDRAWLTALEGSLHLSYTARDPAVDGLGDVVVEEHVLEEGDAIVVPASTWHHVVAETASVTLSLTSLVDLERALALADG